MDGQQPQIGQVTVTCISAMTRENMEKNMLMGGFADPGCNASLIREGTCCFLQPELHGSAKKPDVGGSARDGGKTVGRGSTVHAGNSAYSSMTVIPKGLVCSTKK